MSDEGFVSFPVNDITLALLLLSLVVFAWLAIKSRNIKSFQFQISVFIFIMVIGQVIYVLPDNFSQIPASFEDIGYHIHLVSMVFLSVMLWMRFYYSKKSGKKMIENIDEDV